MRHETETRLVSNQVLRVYKNLWPSIRDFWAFVSNEYQDETYIVFEQQRWTYGHTAKRVTLAARIFQVMYDIRKGDRVAICSRNFPDFIVAFWACHLIGAVSVLVNACVSHAGRTILFH
jgi:acyl-CoA synthetase (AMP-forming)/AMP-acid ligase II